MIGHKFTPVLPSGKRAQMRLSTADHEKISRGLGDKGIVTDLRTGRRWRVSGKACGTPGCQCDARVKPVRRRAGRTPTLRRLARTRNKRK